MDLLTATELVDTAGRTAWVSGRLPKMLPWGWRVSLRVDDGCRYINRDGMSVIVSGAREADGKRWLHVSFARPDRLPSYEDLALVKQLFIGDDAYAIQVFPPKDHHVNIHPFCLHLFSCVDGWPLPEFSGFIGGQRSL
jgi:hypothetical protein